MKNPIQPVFPDSKGILRFKSNEIVKAIFKHSSLDWDDLAEMDFDPDDKIQFAQLTGYSLSGIPMYEGTEETIEAARLMAEQDLTENQARIQTLEEKLSAIKETLKKFTEALSDLY